MKLVSFAAPGRNSYGAVVGDGVFDLGRRLGDRYPTLRAAIAGDAFGAAAAEVKSGAPDIALSQVTLLPPISGFLLSTLIFGGAVTGDVVLSIVLIVAGIILTLRARP